MIQIIQQPDHCVFAEQLTSVVLLIIYNND